MVLVATATLGTQQQAPSTLGLEWARALPESAVVRSVTVSGGAAALTYENASAIQVLLRDSSVQVTFAGMSQPISARVIAHGNLEVIGGNPAEILVGSPDGGIVERRVLDLNGELIAAAWTGHQWITASMLGDTISFMSVSKQGSIPLRCESKAQCTGQAFRSLRLFGGAGGAIGLFDQRGFPLLLFDPTQSAIRFVTVDVLSELGDAASPDSLPAVWQPLGAVWLDNEVVAQFVDMRSLRRVVARLSFAGELMRIAPWPLPVSLVGADFSGYVGGLQSRNGTEFLMYRR